MSYTIKGSSSNFEFWQDMIFFAKSLNMERSLFHNECKHNLLSFHLLVIKLSINDSFPFHLIGNIPMLQISTYQLILELSFYFHLVRRFWNVSLCINSFEHTKIIFLFHYFHIVRRFWNDYFEIVSFEWINLKWKKLNFHLKWMLKWKWGKRPFRNDHLEENEMTWWQNTYEPNRICLIKVFIINEKVTFYFNLLRLCLECTFGWIVRIWILA